MEWTRASGFFLSSAAICVLRVGIRRKRRRRRGWVGLAVNPDRIHVEVKELMGFVSFGSTAGLAHGLELLVAIRNETGETPG